jgi:hypothetical protein
MITRCTYALEKTHDKSSTQRLTVSIDDGGATELFSWWVAERLRRHCAAHFSLCDIRQTSPNDNGVAPLAARRARSIRNGASAAADAIVRLYAPSLAGDQATELIPRAAAWRRQPRGSPDPARAGNGSVPPAQHQLTLSASAAARRAADSSSNYLLLVARGPRASPRARSSGK